MPEIKIKVIRRETKNAFQVILENILIFLWLPKSQITAAEIYWAGQRDVVMEVSEWIMQAKRKEREEELRAKANQE